MSAQRWWASPRALRWGFAPAVVVVLLLPLGVVGFTARQAAPALQQVGIIPFFTDDRWQPASQQFGAAPMLAGTILSSALAILLVAPGAVAWAVRVNFFASARMAETERTLVATLSGVPSVVIGLVGLLAVVPVVRALEPPGLSLLAASIVLAAMCFPTAATAADAAVQQVDQEIILASRALGLGVWDTVRFAVFPSAKQGLAQACLLGLGRALGETLAVMMVAGNTIAWPSSLFAPFRTLNGNIAVEMAYSAGLHRSALFVTGGLLLVLALALVLLPALQSPVRSRS